MTHTYKYAPDDYVVVVWLTDSAAEVRAGTRTWEDAAHGAWAIEAAKATRARVLLAIDDLDEVVGAWHVASVSNESLVPDGKSRRVNRATFELVDDARLSFLLGSSPWPRRRNPQTTLEVRALPGADQLLAGQVPSSGAAQIGDFTLTVNDRGVAVLRMRAGASLTVLAGAA